jgi:hypothetical protein
VGRARRRRIGVGFYYRTENDLKARRGGFAGSPDQATLDVMLDRSGHLIARSRTQLATIGMALSMVMAASDVGWPQAAPPSPSPPSAQPSPPPPSAAVQTPAQPGDPAPPSPPPAQQENPGLINEMGKIFDKSLSILPTLKSPGETIDDLNARAKGASETLSRMTTSSIVTGRVKCPVSVNGAPDCKAAADQLCQARKFKEGKSLTIDSVEACSAKVLIPGRTRKPDDCRTDNYVTRALCQ